MTTQPAEPWTDAAPDDAGETPQATLTVFLALYLILLGFFVMLSANARLSESRSNAVLQSLMTEFRPVLVEPRATSALVAEPVHLELADLFRDHLGDGDWRLETREGQVRTSLPLRRIFSDGGSILKPTRLSLVRRMAEVFGAAQTAAGQSVRVLVGNDGGDALARRRAAAIARDLVRSGVDARRFEVGVDAAAADKIVLALVPAGEG
jgi:hypothetical protein